MSSLAHPLVAEHVDVLPGDRVDGLQEGGGGEEDGAPGVVRETLLARVHGERQLLVEHLGRGGVSEMSVDRGVC